MTISTVGESTVLPDISSCPSWCNSCTPRNQGGSGHFGEEAPIRLSSMPPVEHLDVEQRIGASVWTTTAELDLSLHLHHGAINPVVELFASDVETGLNRRGPAWATLTMAEVDELIELLESLRSQAIVAQAEFLGYTPDQIAGMMA